MNQTLHHSPAFSPVPGPHRPIVSCSWCEFVKFPACRWNQGCQCQSLDQNDLQHNIYKWPFMRKYILVHSSVDANHSRHECYKCAYVYVRTKAPKSRIHAVRSVCGCHNYNMNTLFQAVHQGEQLRDDPPLNLTMSLQTWHNHQTSNQTVHSYINLFLFLFSLPSLVSERLHPAHRWRW